MGSFKLMEEKMTICPYTLEQVLTGQLFMSKALFLACIKGISRIAKIF